MKKPIVHYKPGDNDFLIFTCKEYIEENPIHSDDIIVFWKYKNDTGDFSFRNIFKKTYFCGIIRQLNMQTIVRFLRNGKNHHNAVSFTAGLRNYGVICYQSDLLYKVREHAMFHKHIHSKIHYII